MASHIGIDLGSVVSSICSYDGKNIQVHKSPEQSPVTASMLFVEGNKIHTGFAACAKSGSNLDNQITQFKARIGTGAHVWMNKLKLRLSPEYCVTLVLQMMYDYLPEEVRAAADNGVVIGVPATFTQTQCDAMLDAAHKAGIANVELVHEPIAAVLRAAHSTGGDCNFLVYDMSGDTVDVTLVSHRNGRAGIIDQVSVPLCVTREFSQHLFESIMMPWVYDHFKLCVDFMIHPRYAGMLTLMMWLFEQARLKLNTQESTVVSIPASTIRLKDDADRDIHIEVPIDRAMLNKVIEPRIMETIELAHTLLNRHGLRFANTDRILFLGAQTLYEPIRTMITEQLDIRCDTLLDPLTAVSAGAAIFAQSIDWETAPGRRTSKLGSLLEDCDALSHTIDYPAETASSDVQVRVMRKPDALEVSRCQLDNVQSGWTSGPLTVNHCVDILVPLNKDGDHLFKLFVFDDGGNPLLTKPGLIRITRIPAAIEMTEAPRSIGIETRDTPSGSATRLRYLVRKGASLPYKNSVTFKACDAVPANSSGGLIFKLWEGEQEHAVSDNALLGCYKVMGNMFNAGTIEPDAELVCSYEVNKFGTVSIEVTVPSLHLLFQRLHFRSTDVVQDIAMLREQILTEVKLTEHRLDELAAKTIDDRVAILRDKLSDLHQKASIEDDIGNCRQYLEDLQQAKLLLVSIRSENLAAARQAEVDAVDASFRKGMRYYATPADIKQFDEWRKSAQSLIGNPNGQFEHSLMQMRIMISKLMLQSDYRLIGLFRMMQQQEFLHDDRAAFVRMVEAGERALRRDDMEDLRKIVGEMDQARRMVSLGTEVREIANIY